MHTSRSHSGIMSSLGEQGSLKGDAWWLYANFYRLNLPYWLNLVQIKLDCYFNPIYPGSGDPIFTIYLYVGLFMVVHLISLIACHASRSQAPVNVNRNVWLHLNQQFSPSLCMILVKRRANNHPLNMLFGWNIIIDHFGPLGV